jgi:WD40 repeat protein
VVRTFTGHTEPITDLAFSPDGTMIVSASLDDTAKLWDASTGAELLTLSGHTDDVNAVDFSGDGRWIATAGSEGVAHTWDAATGALVGTLVHPTGEIGSVEFTADGSKLLTGTPNCARLWHLERSGDQLAGHVSAMTAVGISDNPTTLVTAHEDARFRLWNTADGRQIRTHSPGSNSFMGLSVFSPDGRLVATRPPYALKNIVLRRVADGLIVRTLTGHSEPVNAVVFSADSTRLVSASSDGIIVLWDLASGGVVQVFQGDDPTLLGDVPLAISDDGGQIATFDSGAIKLWNTLTGAEIRTFGSADWDSCFVFSHDGTRLLAGDDNARLYNTSDGSVDFWMSAADVIAAGFSPDDSQIFVAGGSKAQLFSADDGTLLRTFEHPDVVNDALLFLDGSRLLTAGNDGIARLWHAFAEASPTTAPEPGTADKFLLVAGGGNYTGNPIVQQTQALADQTHLTCLVRGYRHDEILYLSAFDDWQTRDANSDGRPDADGYASTAAFWSAIDAWSSDTARLFVYLIDHGVINTQTGEHYFRLNPTDYIAATELDAHLDALQQQTGAEVILIVDCCYSGGFVRRCTPVDGARRVVISATTASNLAVYSPPVGAESFSFYFLSFAIQGNTVKDCLRWTQMSFASMGNPAGQVPWMDDNGDGVSDKWDGALAARHVLGRYPAFGLAAPTILAVAPAATCAAGDRMLLWAQLDAAIAPQEVWAVVVPQGTDGTGSDPVTDLTRVDLQYNAQTQRWEAVWTSSLGHLGICAVTYFAACEDTNNTRLIAVPMASEITVFATSVEIPWALFE